MMITSRCLAYVRTRNPNTTAHSALYSCRVFINGKWYETDKEYPSTREAEQSLARDVIADLKVESELLEKTRNIKNELLQMTRIRLGVDPVYNVEKEEGPPNDKR